MACNNSLYTSWTKDTLPLSRFVFCKKILIVIILDSVIDSNSNIWHAYDIDIRNDWVYRIDSNFNQICSNQ